MPEPVYSLDQISQWQSQLKDFAKTPRTRFSKKQAVEALIVEIEEALLQHPFDEVAEKLKDWGLDIAGGSLKQYVNAYRREHGTDSDNATAKRSSGRSKKTTAGKKKVAEKKTAESNEGQSQPSNEVGEVTSTRTHEKAATEKTAASKTAGNFLEMDEDL